MMAGYVIVSTLGVGKFIAFDGSGLKVYRGIDRDPWRCVDDLYYDKKLSSNLVALVKHSHRNYIGNFSAGTVATVEEARQLLAACENKSKDYEIIGLDCLSEDDGQRDISVMQYGFGIDAYVDGYGSLIELGVFQKPDLFRIFHKSLNRYGLFENVDALNSYCNAYCDLAEDNGLEPIDNLVNMYMYAVLPIKQA